MKLIKRKKCIPLIILAICILFGGLFYFSDPFEHFNHYEIPENPNDIVLCYSQADLGITNLKYYTITRSGIVKVFNNNNPISYDTLVEWNKTNSDEVQIDPLTSTQIEHIQKMNPDNARYMPDKNPTNIAVPEVIYYIIQKSEDGYVMKAIKIITYNGSLGNDPRLELKCRSIHTNEICDYIDYAVSSVNK